ncbi:MAG TPA: DNA polymerase ligase N-terminal domain-containing protein [Alphaproteobacteria bacterium]|nr:DNA polymerase ligase N-terminal domain-containing protein [Alphaproteobacteria bacterium]
MSDNTSSQRSAGKQLFVVQKHGGPSLHYDFRLAIGGVLKSWAVPNGPSLDPRVKRLAVATEDQPLQLASLKDEMTEGPQSGAIEIWDRGIYEVVTEKDGRVLTPEEAFDEGKLLLKLQGGRLVGGWSLQRTGRGKKSNWLLIRMKEDGGLVRRAKSKSRQTAS